MKNYSFYLSIFFLFCFSFSQNLQAQESDEINNWFFLHTTAKLNNKWELGNELHIRRDDWVENWRNLLIRPYASYYLNNTAILTAGYSYIGSWALPGSDKAPLSNEHNIWEQFCFRHKLNKATKVCHRYRFEHRFVDQWEHNLNTDEWEKTGREFSNRFRYRITVKSDLAKIKDEQSIYLVIFDEIWINQADNLRFKSLARNWLYLGLGYRLNPQLCFELAYMHQHDTYNATDYLNTPIMQLSLWYKVPVKKS
ncbi:DUF2490 domain-containing protein [Saprospira grandis]|uniref:DUF2490 domain-containing protein n=1 Tax=Saprospira grandis TaxID=1008 RepID=UPI0022DD3190|nr:DUF2490 domain-containing protein [Saprospira grandis]WBM75380.1 DUF2490 domain-containing protein [Saprospira grandis]